MQTKLSPAKRHHSQISMPSRRSSSHHNNNHTRTTNHHQRGGNHHQQQQHHPFENLFHMFGSTFHRSSGGHQQQQRQAQYREQSVQHRAAEQSTVLANKYPKQSSTEYDTMLGRNMNSSSSYVAPSIRAAATSNRVSPANSAASSVQTHQSTPEQTITSSSSSVKSSGSKKSNASAASAWRTAICPRSNKPYYWNVHTRESRWKKPLELASEEEREAIKAKERKQREFFESMERNILRRLEAGKDAARELNNQKESSSKATGGKKEGGDEHLGLGSPMSIATSVATTSNNSANNADAIHNSWLQGSSSTSPTENTNATDDWIAGWITPGSETSSLQNSPSLSTSSMEGLSVFDSSSATNHHRSRTSTGCTGSLSMSPNSLSSFQGSVSSLSREERDDKVYPLGKSKLERIKSNSSRPVIDKPDLIRTISKMEYDLLMVHQLNPDLRVKAAAAAMNNSLNSPKAVSPNSAKRDEPLTPTTATCDILSCLHLTPEAEGLAVSLAGSMEDEPSPTSPLTPTTPNEEDEASLPIRSMSSSSSASASSAKSSASTPSAGVAKPNLTKRNTCGTIYLGSTLSAPDKDALIKCVCGVFRAHLLQTERGSNPSGYGSNIAPYGSKNDEHQIFNDRRAPGDYRRLDTSSIPTLAQVTDFYRSIFLRSQMEVDCIIISLIYVERLIKMSAGKLTPAPKNWRSILFSCMVLASKVWDDLSMWNCDFSKIGPSGVTFSLSRTNELEIALLRALEYKVKVNASEYAKYYFLLRGMLCRSGLANDEISRLSPLDAKGAVAITGGDKAPGASSSSGRSEASKVAKVSMKERSKSHGCVDGNKAVADAMRKGASSSSNGGGVSRTMPPQSSPTSKRVSLEQIVRM